MSSETAASNSASSLIAYEWRRLSRVSHEVLPGMPPVTCNYVAQPFGQVLSTQEALLIRAHLVRSEGNSFSMGQKVVLRMRHADWFFLEEPHKLIRILQASGCQVQGEYVLDCTTQATVVAAYRPMQVGESVYMAELFSGGFAGWAQAAWVLHSSDLPISTRWTMDVDDEGTAMLQAQVPKLRVVQSLEDLEAVDVEADEPLHVNADFNWHWWLHCFATHPVQIVAASPPSQPWNHSESAAGLSSPEGQMLLRLADIAGAFEIPVVVLELCSGFLRHPHHAAVLTCWQEAGYTLHWQASLNLLDVLPCARPRVVLVWVHRSHEAPAPLQGCAWNSARRSSLRDANAIFDHPPALHAPLVLSNEEMRVYMDPWYMPPSRGGQRPAASPEQFRLRSPQQTAGCFLPQYQTQHHLSEQTLASQGLLGFLLRDQGQVRFFSGAEIGSLHGAVRPLLLVPAQTKQMSLLGGSTAAIVGLVYACRALHMQSVPAPDEAVSMVLHHRLHSSNSLFVPVGSSWLVCRKDQVADVLATDLCFVKGPLPERTSAEFVRLALQFPDGDVQLQVPNGSQPAQVLNWLGANIPVASLPHEQQQHLGTMTIRLPHRPCIESNGNFALNQSAAHLCTVATAVGTYIIDTASPRLWPQLLNVFDDLSGDSEDLICYGLSGQRLWYAEDFKHCIIADTLERDGPAISITFLAQAFPQTQLTREDLSITICCPAQAATDFWLGFPFPLTEALGWHTEVINFPCQDHRDMSLHLRPDPARIYLQPSSMQGQLRIWYVVSSLNKVQANVVPEPLCTVEIQVVAQSIWQGKLPGSFQVALLEEWWRAASEVTALPPDVRVFSGPHPLWPDSSLAAVRDERQHCVVRKSGALLLTLHPACAGGGVKDENLNWSKTRLAALCLAKGIDLNATTCFVDAVAAAANNQKLWKALQSGSDEDKWQQVVHFAKAAQVAMPEGTNHVAKAELRARSAVQRRKQDLRVQITAAEVCLTPGFFKNEDGSDAAILEGLRPGVSGVLLADPKHAVELLRTMRGIQPDELALVVLGHNCPNPKECNQQLSFPAKGRNCGSQLLLAGCLHNLGGKQVSVAQQHNVTVDLPDVVYCTFTVHADECDAANWKAFSEYPVKTVVAAFGDAGLDKVLSEPWGRRHLLKGKGATPNLADQVSFHARVDQKTCDTLLACSGHNLVYMIPRRQDHSLQPGYSVIWIGQSRAEALKAALQVPGQLGIVRAKNRYGLRVHEAKHDSTFQQLRPGQTMPSKVAVSHLFRLGPVPPSADASAVQAWATASNWKVKVLKALGPQHWLIGSEIEPPLAYPSFNGQTVLITQVQQRSMQQRIVQAGPAATEATTGPHQSPP